MLLKNEFIQDRVTFDIIIFINRKCVVEIHAFVSIERPQARYIKVKIFHDLKITTAQLDLCSNFAMDEPCFKILM